ncbi:hypothetical protein C8F01DRAFT_3813 [Mycena amicta]|nr:hypothetical protein C8F01DRAFT_3813 [Mycena amicta]
MNTLALDRTRLSEVEGEIQRFETSPAALRIENLCGQLNEYKYPVLTLPSEIITEIFTHYLPPYPEHPPLVGPGSPTHLLRICRPWRHIALRSPRLWRAIKLGDAITKISEQHVEMVQTWLQRSGSSPLSLRLEFSTVSVGRSEDSLIRAVVARRSRWEYVDLRAPPAQLSSIAGHSPRLVQMTLTTTWGHSVIFSLQNAHLLRSISLWNIGYDISSLPWDQLTSLALINNNFVQSAVILQAAPNLLRCQLSPRDEGTVEGIRIRLPRLEILSLDSSGDKNIDENILGVFTLPSLRKLEISERLLGLYAVERLKSLILRSGCRLERLRIISISAQSSQRVVDACCIAFPHVDIDAFDYWRFSDDWQAEKEEYWDFVAESSEDLNRDNLEGEEELEEEDSVRHT